MHAFGLRLPALCVVFSLWTATAFAQGGPPTATPPKASAATDFAQEPWVILHRDTVTSMNADGTGYREISMAIRLQSDAAVKAFGVLGIPFASASDHVDIHFARVRRPDGTVLETPPSQALEQAAEVTRAAPFYSDLKEMQLPIRSLRVGDTLEWEARIVSTRPEAPGQFWGQDSFILQGVALKESHELRVPAATHLTVWTNPKDIAPPTDASSNGIRTLRWIHANLKPTVGAAAIAAQEAENRRVRTPAEELDTARGVAPSFAWSTFADWAAVGAWYRGLEADRASADSTVKAKVAELTAGKQTQEEKAHAVYNFVATQVRYIGVAFGIGRFQPHTAAEVLANQYGDCKDKHTLLAAMLSTIGISSDAVLIGAGIRFNEAVPSPSAFNHLITRAHIDGHDVWLDTTAEVAPWRMLVSVIRDKPALAVPDAGTASITQTPADLPFPAFAKATVTGSLDNDLTSDSRIEMTYRGDDELILRAALRQVTPAQYGQFVEVLMSNMGFGGTTSQAEISHLEDSSQPLTIAFHYHRVKESDWGADRVTAIFLPTEVPAVDTKHPAVASLDLATPRSQTSSVAMKLPEKWSAELPEAVHAHAPFAQCDVTYRLDQGTLFAERRIVILKSKVPPTDWKAYKTWYEQCDAGSVPYLQLTHSGRANPSGTPSNSEAARLIEEANDAIKIHEMDKARDLLDKAKALNPRQRNLWGTYGYHAYELGQSNEAIDDYRKELQYHPDETWVYSPLAEELLRTNHPDQAVKTLRSGVAADPANLRANTMLVGLLANEPDKGKQAIAAGTAALKLLPPDDPQNAVLALAVAIQQIAAGSMADAAAILSKVLKVTDNIGVKNDAAYLLAETGTDLPIAEATERSVLDALTAETRSWTLDENPQILRQKSTLLIASWDTMGWILFRAGHVQEARSFVEPAWHINHTIEVARHLGDIALADHDATAASAAYQLGLANYPPQAKGLPASTAVEVKSAQEGLARARAAGATAEVKDPHAALQKLRILPLGPSKGPDGHAEYRVLIAQGKAEVVRPNGETTIPDAEALLRAASFAAFTPQGIDGKIVFFGYINCTGHTCEFVIEP